MDAIHNDSSAPPAIHHALLKDADIDDTDFLRDIAALPYVERILLFGSRTTQDYMEGADLDIAVDCPDASDEEWHHITDIAERAYTLLSIDCVRLDTLKDGFFKEQILQHSKVICDKRGGA